MTNHCSTGALMLEGGGERQGGCNINMGKLGMGKSLEEVVSAYERPKQSYSGLAPNGGPWAMTRRGDGGRRSRPGALEAFGLKANF